MFLQGRNEAVLAEVAAACTARGATMQTKCLDVRAAAEMDTWLSELCALDLVILNAGMSTHVGENREPEPWDEAEAVLDVNLKAAMRIVHTVLPTMRGRGSGQIALMSSLAAYFGLPVTCASKAGLKAYGEALRGWLGPEGIQFNVIMPGYVKSPMCEAMPGPKPFLWTPERAAKVIRRGLERDQARISFPFPLNLGTWWLAVLSVRVLRWLGYGRCLVGGLAGRGGGACGTRGRQQSPRLPTCLPPQRGRQAA